MRFSAIKAFWGVLTILVALVLVGLFLPVLLNSEYDLLIIACSPGAHYLLIDRALLALFLVLIGGSGFLALTKQQKGGSHGDGDITGI